MTLFMKAIFCSSVYLKQAAVAWHFCMPHNHFHFFFFTPWHLPCWKAYVEPPCGWGGSSKWWFEKLTSSTARVLSPPCVPPVLPSPSLLHPELMAAGAAKSSQCDKVMWSQRSSGKVSCISGSIYTDYAAMRKGPKIKINGESGMISLRPDCWLRCLRSYPDGYEAVMTAGAKTYCWPLHWPSWCHVQEWESLSALQAHAWWTIVALL